MTASETHEAAGADSDDWLKFITDLQMLQYRAHALGLQTTASLLNKAIKKSGWEYADLMIDCNQSLK